MSASTDTGGAISFRTGGRNLEPVVLGTAGIVGLLVIWQAIASFSTIPRYFFPSPADVVRAAFELVQKGILPVYIADSLGRYFAGVGLGVSIGLILGLAIGMSQARHGCCSRC